MPKLTEPQVIDLVDQIGNGTLPGKVLDPLPPAQTQEGPTCGFYALSIVMDYWKAKGRTTASAPARARDVNVQKRDQSETSSESLRHIGKRVGALDMGSAAEASTGAVLTTQQLGRVAKAVKFANFIARIKTRNNPGMFIYSLCNAIDADIPPIVAFDVHEGDPVPDRGGQHSHWGVIVGYFKRTEVDHFLATHGHGGYYIWTASDLQRSNFALAGTILNEGLEVKITFSGSQIPLGHRAARTQWVSQEAFEKYQVEAKQKKLTLHVIDKRVRPAVTQDLAHHFLLVEPA